MTATRPTLRPATDDDRAFLLEVYGATRQEELDRTQWNRARREAFVEMQFNAQRHHYQVNFPEAEHLVILANSERVGRLYIARLDAAIRILDITIMPSRRTSGIGTSLLTDILKESEETGKPVGIYVESFNRSLGLFERLGFCQVDASGFNLLMEWNPGPR